MIVHVRSSLLNCTCTRIAALTELLRQGVLVHTSSSVHVDDYLNVPSFMIMMTVDVQSCICTRTYDKMIDPWSLEECIKINDQLVVNWNLGQLYY